MSKGSRCRSHSFLISRISSIFSFNLQSIHFFSQSLCLRTSPLSFPVNCQFSIDLAVILLDMTTSQPNLRLTLSMSIRFIKGKPRHRFSNTVSSSCKTALAVLLRRFLCLLVRVSCTCSSILYRRTHLHVLISTVVVLHQNLIIKTAISL